MEEEREKLPGKNYVLSLRGKSSPQLGMLNNVAFQTACKEYVRSKNKLKGAEAFTPVKFMEWINDMDNDILNDALRRLPADEEKDEEQQLGAMPLQQRNVKIRAVRNFLGQLGFGRVGNKKGCYYDGHERPAVKADRARYLVEKLEQDKLTKSWRRMPEALGPCRGRPSG